MLICLCRLDWSTQNPVLSEEYLICISAQVPKGSITASSEGTFGRMGSALMLEFSVLNGIYSVQYSAEIPK